MASPVAHMKGTCAHCNCIFEGHPSSCAPVSAVPCGHMHCKTCMATLRSAAPSACRICTPSLTGEICNIGVGMLSEEKQVDFGYLEVSAGANVKEEAGGLEETAPREAPVSSPSRSRGHSSVMSPKRRKVAPPDADDATRYCCSCAGESIKTVATHACCSCPGGLDFCEAHATTHQSLRFHVVKSLTELAADPVSQNAIECPEHPGLPCVRFCVGHNKLLCSECCVFDHPPATHAVRPLEALVAYFVKEINSVLPALAAQSAATSEASTKAADSLTDLVAGAARMFKRVDEISTQLHVAVDVAMYDARLRVQQSLDARRALLEGQERALAVTSNQLVSTLEVCMDALEQGTPTSLAIALQDVQSQRPLLQPLPSAVPVSSSFVEVSKTADVMQAISAAFEFVESAVDLSASALVAPGIPLPDGGPAPNWHVTFSPKGATGCIVPLTAADVKLDIKDAIGESVGSSTVSVSADGSAVDIAFEVTDTSVTDVTMTLRVQKLVLHCWPVTLVS